MDVHWDEKERRVWELSQQETAWQIQDLEVWKAQIGWYTGEMNWKKSKKYSSWWWWQSSSDRVGWLRQQRNSREWWGPWTERAAWWSWWMQAEEDKILNESLSISMQLVIAYNFKAVCETGKQIKLVFLPRRDKQTHKVLERGDAWDQALHSEISHSPVFIFCSLGLL